MIDAHQVLSRLVYDGLDARVEQGLDVKRMPLTRLAVLAGLNQRHTYQVLNEHKWARAETWDKLLAVAWPPELVENDIAS